jgi:hypothetical protein
LSQTN